MQRRQWIHSGLAAASALVAQCSLASVADGFRGPMRPVDTRNRVEGWMNGPLQTFEVKGRVIGKGRPKLIASTSAKRPQEFLDSVRRLAAHPELDVIELRLDYLGNQRPEVFADLTRRAAGAARDKILLATLRNGTDGGSFSIADSAYFAAYEAILATGRPDLVDLEIFRDLPGIRRLIALAHELGIRVLLSDHELKFTPEEGEIIRRLQMEDALGADILKFSSMGLSPEDALTIMSATAKMRRYYTSKPMLTMAIGRYGVMTRLTGEGFGSDLTFVSVDGHASAPGQVPLEVCVSVLDAVHRGMNP